MLNSTSTLMLSELRSSVVNGTLPPLRNRPPAATMVARMPPPRSMIVPGAAVCRAAPPMVVAAT